MRYALSALVTVAVLAFAAPASAQSDSCVPRASKTRGEPATHARAKRVIDRYAFATINSCDGVEGMGVGAADGIAKPDPAKRQHVIVIYLRDKASRPKRAKSIAGVTIRYVVTGKITPL
jgi:hypothetical protein